MKLAKFAKLDEDKQEARINKAVKRLFKVEGMTKDHESDVLMDYEVDDDSLFFKFMSTGGVTDDANGLAIKVHLLSTGIKHDATDKRNVIMKLSDFLKEF
jgi:hypothetical protein